MNAHTPKKKKRFKKKKKKRCGTVSSSKILKGYIYLYILMKEHLLLVLGSHRKNCTLSGGVQKKEKTGNRRILNTNIKIMRVQHRGIIRVMSVHILAVLTYSFHGPYFPVPRLILRSNPCGRWCCISNTYQPSSARSGLETRRPLGHSSASLIQGLLLFF